MRLIVPQEGSDNPWLVLDKGTVDGRLLVAPDFTQAPWAGMGLEMVQRFF